MSSITLFFLLIPMLGLIFLLINIIFAPHNPYQEKDSPFECGFHSHLGQTRTQFSISYYIHALLFLLFDIEIIMVYPFAVSGYTNGKYGLFTELIFLFSLSSGLVYELGKNALKIDSRQTSIPFSKPKSVITSQSSLDITYRNVELNSILDGVKGFYRNLSLKTYYLLSDVVLYLGV